MLIAIYYSCSGIWSQKASSCLPTTDIYTLCTKQVTLEICKSTSMWNFPYKPSPQASCTDCCIVLCWSYPVGGGVGGWSCMLCCFPYPLYWCWPWPLHLVSWLHLASWPLYLVLVVFIFFQLVQPFNLYWWWLLPVATCAGGGFHTATGANTVRALRQLALCGGSCKCGGGGIHATCTVWRASLLQCAVDSVLAKALCVKRSLGKSWKWKEISKHGGRLWNQKSHDISPRALRLAILTCRGHSLGCSSWAFGSNLCHSFGVCCKQTNTH